MREGASKRLVIDTDIMRAVSETDSARGTDPRPKCCRDLLLAVFRICHAVVVTPEIAQEWDRNQSRFGATWRVSMSRRKGKTYRVQVVDDAALSARIERFAPSDKALEAVKKDMLLISAALVADGIIVSLDETARQAFNAIAPHVGELRGVTWVNPELDAQTVPWLEGGAEPKLMPRLGDEGRRSLQK